MEGAITHEQLRTIARDERAAHSPGPQGPWPDCFDVAEAIRQRLATEHDIDTEAMETQEYQLAGGYRHYALVLNPSVLGESAVVDASFDQFATEADTPIDIAPRDEIADIVIATPRNRYLFA